jgi:hypothetical protein
MGMHKYAAFEVPWLRCINAVETDAADGPESHILLAANEIPVPPLHPPRRVELWRMPLVDLITGARPNFMKIAPIIRAIQARKLRAAA